MLSVKKTLLHTAAIAALLGSFALVSPVQAQSNNNTDMTPVNNDMTPADNAMAATPPATAPSAQPMGGKPMMHGMDKVEMRIKTLHDKLKITPNEEKDWSEVAQTMRDNEANLEQLIQQRHANPEQMTAIDDLQSFQKIWQAHADGLTKMTSSFSALYNDMTDEQKKNADEVFRAFEGHRHGKGMKHHHAS